MTKISRYAAFTSDPSGGNPAGVVLDAAGLADEDMQRIAAEVGYSETAFAVPQGNAYRVRYFSPLAEVPFCGHATIATAVALGPGEHLFVTNAGEVPVSVDEKGRATLTSVTPSVADLSGPVLTALLDALRWSEFDLDETLPPKIAFAGAHHPIIATGSRKRLADLDYDVPALTALMNEHDWTTIQLVFRREDEVFDVRDPFPIGGVYEDPATGAAAAALGGYLRDLWIVSGDTELTLHQGDDLGRPSLITVTLVDGSPGIRVTGNAVPIQV